MSSELVLNAISSLSTGQAQRLLSSLGGMPTELLEYMLSRVGKDVLKLLAQQAARLLIHVRNEAPANIYSPELTSDFAVAARRAAEIRTTLSTSDLATASDRMTRAIKAKDYTDAIRVGIMIAGAGA